jgi:sortase A
MRDKRPVDELSIEELERVLLVKKREARMQRFRGGVPSTDTPIPTTPKPPSAAPPPVSIPAEVPAYATPQEIIAYEDDGVPRFEDDSQVVERQYLPVMGYENRRPGLWRRVINQFFLVIEVGAILGLIALIFFAYQGLKTVNKNIEKTDAISATSEAELAMRQIQPTATPLIQVSEVVLPGGHIWDASGQHQFNLNEVPAPYRSAFRAQLEAPRAEFEEVPEGGPIRVQIPAISVDAGVRDGDDWISLQAGVGRQPGSANPGQQGNLVLAGHNDIFGEVFRRTEELQVGDEIRVQATTGQWYTYVVREKQVVEPAEVWVLDQGLGQQTPIVTLITCYPYRVNTHRMVVFAELVSS